MRLLHIITDLSTGGSEIMLYKLLNTMTRPKFEPFVVSLTDEGTVAKRIKTLGVPIHSCGMRRGTVSLTGLWRLRHAVRSFGPDLIQGWMYHGNLAALLAARMARPSTPVLWNIRQALYDLRQDRRMTRIAIRAGARLSDSSARIVYNARASAIQHEALGYSKSKTLIIPNGFECERFVVCPAARERLRTEINVPRDTLIIGLIARYHPMKDHENFLQAASHLISELPTVRFVLVGKGVDARNSELYVLLQQLGLTSQVYLLGERHDTPALNSSFDIASLSSWSEAFPNAIGEAMACGVPCVATDVGESGFIIGSTGRIVPPKNPRALADAWYQLINMGSEARQQLGLAARRRIVSNYSLPAIAARYQNLYEEVADHVWHRRIS